MAAVERGNESQKASSDGATSFELKFLVSEQVAARVEAWAGDRLALDEHGDPIHDGRYFTTTLYLDTPAFDVFFRTPGFRRRKYRVRRYGSESTLFLERKVRRGDEVRKQREPVALAELDRLLAPSAPATAETWFRREVLDRGMGPSGLVSYWRTAFVGAGSDGPLRLTLDRAVRGRATSTLEVAAVDGGHPLVDGEVICELKFKAAMPALFRQLVADLALAPASVSKYRRLMAVARANEGTR